MIKGLAIYTAGVGSGIVLSGYALRELAIPWVSKQLAISAERALDEAALDRIKQEVEFRMIEIQQELPGPDTATGKFSNKLARLIAPID